MRARARIRARVAAWARARQGLDELPVTLRARRIYILPTRTGLAVAMLLLLMMATALNYNNSSGLLFTFMLASFAVVGMHECHRTLKNLQLLQAIAHDSFAGEAGRLELRFANPTADARLAMCVQVGDARAGRFELPGRAVTATVADYAAIERGRHPLERVLLSTTAPLGLFRAWAWLHLPQQAIVYPAASGELPLPGGGGLKAQENAPGGAGTEEWSALRPFQPGDSPRSVAWKQFARGAPLLVSQYEGTQGEQRLLDYASLYALGTEARLSQLCAWILQCEQRGEAYALRLPDQSFTLGRGVEHRQRALRALAMFGALA